MDADAPPRGRVGSRRQVDHDYPLGHRVGLLEMVRRQQVVEAGMTVAATMTRIWETGAFDQPFADEVEFGLALLLDGVELLVARSAPS